MPLLTFIAVNAAVAEKAVIRFLLRTNADHMHLWRGFQAGRGLLRKIMPVPRASGEMHYPLSAVCNRLLPTAKNAAH